MGSESVQNQVFGVKTAVGEGGSQATRLFGLLALAIFCGGLLFDIFEGPVE